MTNTAADAALARRSILGFGEMLAIVARCAGPPAVAIRRADALGASLPLAEGNPWFDAVVVPPGAAPPADTPDLPTCIWTTAAAVPGRTTGDLAMPVMGMALADLAPRPSMEIVEPPPGLIGTINAAAYGQAGAGYAAAFENLVDPRLRRHGVIIDGEFACVAVTLEIEDDICIHYVATAAAHRRQGLAAALLANVMAAARTRGLRTATLQSSPDGLGVYTALGFRRLGLLRGFVRGG